MRDWSPPPPSERSIPAEKRPLNGADPQSNNPGQVLHAAVWLADLQRIDELLEAQADINDVDKYGASSLMLAIELLPRAHEYRDVVCHLLDRAADPRLRSSTGWSPLDEAVSIGDKELVALLFSSTQKTVHVRWQARLNSLAWSLSQLPDFECSIRWEFESPVLPWFSKIAPSDSIRLKKRGKMLRVDSTLASWKRFRFSKRRDLTTLFRGDRVNMGTDSTEKLIGSRTCLCMLNHSKRTMVDVTEGLDVEEAGAVVQDLMSADVMQWDMQMDTLEVAEATTWLGSAAGPCRINEWEARRFDVRGTLGLAVRKKGSRKNNMTFQEYFGYPLPADACLPELRAEFKAPSPPVPLSRGVSKMSNVSEATEGFDTSDFFRHALDAEDPLPDVEAMSTTSEVLTSWPQSQAAHNVVRDDRNYNSPRCRGDGDIFAHSKSAAQARCHDQPSKQLVGGSAPSAPGRGRGRAGSRPETNDKVGKTTRTISGSVWFATNFAIPLQQFMPIIEALATEHETMRRLKQFLASETLQGIAKSVCEDSAAERGATGSGYVFPVRASIPLNLAVRAIIHVEAFQLRSPGALPADLFEVPDGYQVVSRREAQKTPNRARKRMLLANLAL